MKSILDPSFKYKPSYATDLKAKFKKIEQERKANAKEAAEKVEQMPAKRRA